MTELIKIRYENDNPAVSARDLYEFLEINTRYNDWFNRMCDYGFEKDTDYYSILSNRTDGKAGRQRTDAIMTIDMAKEICMLQRNEKGKQARQYFIQVEKAWNDPSLVMARALKIAQSQIAELTSQNTMLLEENTQTKKRVEELKPAKEYVDEVLQSDECITVTQIAADYGLTATALNRILNEERIQYKVNRQWVLYSAHMGQGYTKTATIRRIGEDGKQHTTIHTYWTQKGRRLIWSILRNRGIYPVN